MRLIAFISFLFTFVASAQEVVYDRYLLPVYVPTPAEGALGSRWETEVIISNVGSTPVHVGNLTWPCGGLLCFDVAIPAGVSVPLVFRSLTQTGIPSRFLDIERGSRDVAVQLRVRDVSRAETNWGSEVPVIKADALPPSVHLTAIPLHIGYRHMLRVYDASRTVTAARVHVYDVNPNFREQFLHAEPDRHLRTFDLSLFRGAGDQPNYGEYADLAALAAESEHDVIRITIEPLNGAPRMWAMVTVTNNVTQQITNITPQGPARAPTHE